MRNLVICCDGTWNTPNNLDDGLPAPTNVYKFHAAVRENDTQKRYYKSGVGTSGGRARKLIGGGLGTGIDDEIKSPYKWLCEHYRGPAHDRIFLIGFSRGAYTVRSLAGLIGRVGLFDLTGDALQEPAKWSIVYEAYKRYRSRKTGADFAPDVGLRMNVAIDFLGVFDTVGALGIPNDFAILRSFTNRRKYMFHDTELGKDVRCARHAVAIDEQRQSFMPTLWTNTDPNRDVKEIWFPGVHGDVGGSYADTGLGDITLKWMIEEAQTKGLAFESKFVDQLDPTPTGLLHDSYAGFFKVLRSRPRGVPLINAANVHTSAVQRHKAPPLVQPLYRPTLHLAKGASAGHTIPARQRWTNTGIYLEGGGTYQISSEGEWIDSTHKSGPEGMIMSGSPKQAAFGFSNFLTRATRVLWAIPKANETKAIYNRRHDTLPWFTLIGVVANNAGEVMEDVPYARNKKAQAPRHHQVFHLGRNARITPKAGGYLYCYPNDIWWLYENNKGRVHMTATRL